MNGEMYLLLENDIGISIRWAFRVLGSCRYCILPGWRKLLPLMNHEGLVVSLLCFIMTHHAKQSNLPQQSLRNPRKKTRWNYGADWGVLFNTFMEFGLVERCLSEYGIHDNPWYGMTLCGSPPAKVNMLLREIPQPTIAVVIWMQRLASSCGTHVVSYCYWFSGA